MFSSISDMFDFFRELGSNTGDMISGLFTNLLNFAFNFFEFLFDVFFGWVNLPDFPVELANSLYTFVDLIFDNLGLLGFFVRLSTLQILIPLFIFVFNFHMLYKFVMWFFNKIGKLFINL